MWKNVTVFGYDMEPPAKDKMADWMAENGLRLDDYESLRGEERGRMSIYGFVLASPAATSPPPRERRNPESYFTRA